MFSLSGCLLRTIQDLEAVGVDLYLDQQHLDTTIPPGKLLFHVTGAFSEFERSMIRQRVNAGLSAIKAKIKRDGHFTTRAGIVCRRLGRPGQSPSRSLALGTNWSTVWASAGWHALQGWGRVLSTSSSALSTAFPHPLPCMSWVVECVWRQTTFLKRLQQVGAAQEDRPLVA
jgi:hypothetical protein